MTCKPRCKKRFSALFISLLISGCVFIFSVLALPRNGLTTSSEISPMKRILILNSYHPGYVWGESVNKGIRSVLNSSDISINIRYEFMDTKHLRPDVIFKRLRELYSMKYARFQFDVIIATDNNALNFLLLYRDEIFPETPVVFCGINGLHENMIGGRSGFTGFAEDSDLRGTLEVALNLHPSTKHVALVSGTSTSSLINQARMMEIIPDYKDKVELIDLSRLNPSNLKNKLQNLPEDTIIIYLSYYKMEDGTFLTVKESTSFVFDNSALPIYSPWEYTMGYGIVGGMMLSGEKEGQRAAYYALKILSGTPIEELPVVHESEISPIFDYEMLKHFHVSRFDLPEKTTIKNEPQTVYFRYVRCFYGIAAGYCSCILETLRKSILAFSSKPSTPVSPQQDRWFAFFPL